MERNPFYWPFGMGIQQSSVASPKQSGRSPNVAALFSAINFSSNIRELLQLHDAIQI